MLQSVRKNEGVATLWATMFLLIMVMFTGLAIDTGYMVWTRQQLQIAADGSSLAGALFVKSDQDLARVKSKEIGFKNVAARVKIQLDLNNANAADGDIVLGKFDRSSGTFTPDTADPNAVRVTTSRTAASPNGALALLFGPIFNVDDVDITAHAIAMQEGGFGAGVIALDTDVACSFDVRGTAGAFVVNDGAIYVDSDNPEAACHAGKPTIDAEGLYVGGSTDKGFEDKVNFDGEIYEGEEPIGDPLADLPEPAYDPFNPLGEVRIEGGIEDTIFPGYYDGGITVRNGVLHMEPGIYIVDGAGFDVNGGDIFGFGVMIYVIDTTPGDPQESAVDIRGNGIIELSPLDTDLYPSTPLFPDPTPYEPAGVVIFQARDNTNDSRILGTANTSISGTLYFPSNHIELGGTSDNFATGLIANTIELHGNGIMQINYQGQFGTLPVKVFLVE